MSFCRSCNYYDFVSHECVRPELMTRIVEPDDKSCSYFEQSYITIGNLLDFHRSYNSGDIRIEDAGTGRTIIKSFIPSRHDIYRDIIVRSWRTEIYVDNGQYADRSLARCRIVISIYGSDFHRIREETKHD